MKRNILAALAMAASCTVFAQSYQVVVTTTDGDKRVFSTSDVSSIQFEDAPIYLDSDQVLSAIYNPRTGNALYQLIITDSEVDEWGDPADLGGFQLSLGLVGDLSDDNYNAVLPAGYYNAGLTDTSYTFNLEKSGMWLRLAEGPEGVTQLFMLGGTVDVRHTGDGQYDLRAEMDAMGGERVDVRYQGPIKFAPGMAVADKFTEDQNVDFSIGQGLYWGNWYVHYADDMAVEFYNGKFDENNTLTEGYYMRVECFQPKNEDPENFNPVRMADGVYNVEPREIVTGYTNLPFTWIHGKNLDVWGVDYPVGSYLNYTAANGERRRSFFTGGTMTVSDNGTKIKFDFVDEYGIHTTGTYEGTPYIENRCDNYKSEPTDYDMVDRDVVVDMTKGQLCLDYVTGEEIYPDTNLHTIYFVDPSWAQYDYLCLSLFCEDNVLEDGVYEMNDQFKDFCGLQGRLNYGRDMLYSWYGDLSQVDDEGYNTFLAPVRGGKVTVSTVEGGARKFEFDLKTSEGHSITGVFEGTLNTYVDPSIGAKVVKQRNRVKGPRK